MGFRVNTSRSLVGNLALDARMSGEDFTDYAGDCTAPVELHLFGYPDKLLVEWGVEPSRALAERLYARCRKCEACLRYRARLWTARAIGELGAANRTWFGTLTVAPAYRFRAKLEAAHKVATARREPWEDLPASDQFKALADEISPEVTRWLKRVRKQAATPLRYLLVCEAHKDGFPHFHLLLHEPQGAVTKALLEKQWRIGFSHWRLVDRADKAATTYVCKYLSKSALTRVRASQAYGQAGQLARLLTEQLHAATRIVDEAQREVRQGGQ